MTLHELRDGLERTPPAWETVDLYGVLANGQPALVEPAPGPTRV
jgi:hypothetical protein